MQDSKQGPQFPPKTRQSSRISWLLSSVVVVLVIARVSLYIGEKSEYTLCSETNRIYTVDEAQPNAQCIYISGDRITDIGSSADIRSRRTTHWVSKIVFPTRNVRYIDPSSIIVPGLADAHAHLLAQGKKMQLQLDGSNSIQEVIERIKVYILSHPDVHANRTVFIEGMGWDQTKWPGAAFPTAADLERDPLLRGRPIVLSRVDVHATWVSERVLELMAPIPPDSEIEGGSVIRDASGKPTGIFVDNAMVLIPSPPWTPEKYLDFFHTAVKEALKYGLTSVHDAATDPDAVLFFKGSMNCLQGGKDGKLPIRLYLMAVPFSENFTDDWQPSRIERLTNYGAHGRLNLRGVKLFTDGALGSWGAALLAPYSDKPDTRGIMRSSGETMAELIRSAWQAELQVNVHCIGDRANKVVLDVFEDILEGKGEATKLDVSKTSDMWYAETRLGPERIKGAYAYRTLLEASPNNVLPLGSDFPVEGVNPLLGFYAAVSRLSIDGTSPHGDGGWFPDERLTQRELGSLSIGKKADFVIMDRDIMTVNVSEILGTRVTATVIDGKVAYGSIGTKKSWWSPF
ncbi:amidohydrolase family-domain-containing protein [Mycena sp. CBHHK59/15]|nr:amidohydrolase family-domain-containing protein [Mycena sp. CBHHK59/15]